jgi:hypothetical protein
MTEADNAWDMSQTRMLYESAVPLMEKKPFRLFIDRKASGKLEVKVLKDEKGLFAAFMIVPVYADIVLVDYFEIMDDYKGQGVEPEALEQIKEILPGARIAIVARKDDTERNAFYEAAGMKKADYGIKEGDVELDIYISPEEYDYIEFDELSRTYANAYGTEIAVIIHRA